MKNAAEEAGVDVGVPESGISTDQYLDRFYEILSTNFDSVVIILDEVDLLVGRQRGSDDEPGCSKLLYLLSGASQLGRIEGHVSVAALTNDPDSWKISTAGRGVRSILRTSSSLIATRTNCLSPR